MIFSIPGHIEMIRNGLYCYSAAEMPIKKTQTRRPNRGIYQVEGEYAVQSRRGAKAETDIKIMMNRIWKEKRKTPSISAPNIKISSQDAQAEGGYGPADYEREFRKAYPKWDGPERWAYAFHAIVVHL